ncbi:PEP-utilizing enzyme [Kribbella soli]
MPLADATVDAYGGKAGGLGALIRAGLPVPDGVVVPAGTALNAPAGAAVNRVLPPAGALADRAGVPDGAVVDRAVMPAGAVVDGAGVPGGQVMDAEVVPDGGVVHGADVPGGPVVDRAVAPAGAVVDGMVLARGGIADELGRWLEQMGDDPLVAVRSSAANEDTALTSAAGQHDSFLGVRGLAAVLDAVRACRASVWSPRAVAYRNGAEPPPMAVIVQLQLDSDVSGVMFTTDGTTTIEASWGLGPSVVEGRVTPDRYQVADGRVTRTIADKQTTLTLSGTHQVPATHRRIPTLSDATAVHLAALAHQAATALGAPQDLEWAITADAPWLLQSRPITAQPPPTPATRTPAPPTAGTLTAIPGTPGTLTGTPGSLTATPGTPGSLTGTAAGLTGTAGILAGTVGTLTGTPGSHGTATGPARIVRGPADFPQVRPGDILICPFTDPAWTPLLSIAAGVVTEQGGVLSHAAIIARERGIPAVLAVPNATTQIPSKTPLTINGTTGTIHL